MSIKGNNLNLGFSLGGRWFQVSNLVQGKFQNPVPGHSHGAGSFEIHYIDSGYGTATINEKSYEIRPGTLFITGPHVRHSQIPEEKNPMHEFCIYLKLDENHKDMSCQTCEKELFLEFIHTSFWFGNDMQQAGELIKEIFREQKERQVGYITQVELLLKLFVIKLIRGYGQYTRFDKTVIQTSIAEKSSVIIEEYFLYEFQSLSLVELADRIGLSSRQTERFLLKCYGKTFMQKKTEARMPAAVLLLSDKSSSIALISERLGYSSAEHFAVAFKRYYGQSPSEYRRQKI